MRGRGLLLMALSGHQYRLLHWNEALQLPGLLMALKAVDEIDLDLCVRKPRFGEPID